MQTNSETPADLLIIELDERLEFGVFQIASVFHPDANTSCTNLSCNPGNTMCGCGGNLHTCD